MVLGRKQTVLNKFFLKSKKITWKLFQAKPFLQKRQCSTYLLNALSTKFAQKWLMAFEAHEIHVELPAFAPKSLTKMMAFE